MRKADRHGTYYYGACVDAVAGESDTTNNCTLSLTVTVDGPPPDLVVGGKCDRGPRGRDVLARGDGAQPGGWGVRGDNGAVQTLDRRDDHDIRHDGGHGRGCFAFHCGRLWGNDQADGAVDAWHILLRRVRGRGAQGVRHHQQLLVVREFGRKLKLLEKLLRAWPCADDALHRRFLLPMLTPGSRAAVRVVFPQVRGGRCRSNAARARCRIRNGLLRPSN